MDRNNDDFSVESGEMVALRKESVDRNIFITSFNLFWLYVALRKESVDRNAGIPFGAGRSGCRSPQGERG